MPVQERKAMSWGVDPDAITSPGGPSYPFTAAAALKIGDAVWISAANTVNKSAVAADGVKFIGFVIGGGGSFGGGYGIFDSGSVGLSLVASGKVAEVQVAGIASVTSAILFSHPLEWIYWQERTDYFFQALPFLL